MRGRIEAMLDRPICAMWVGTFHGLAHRLLRAHWREAELPEAFQILDSDDQLRCLRRVLRDLYLDESQWPAKQAQNHINAHKDEGLCSKHLYKGNFWLAHMIRIYAAHEETCARTGIVDFAALSRSRRTALLRARGDQGCLGLPSLARQSRRRRRLRARGQYARPRYRCPHPGYTSRNCARTRAIPGERRRASLRARRNRRGECGSGPAFIAKGTGKAVGEDTAREILAKIMFHISQIPSFFSVS
jgi:hypothetical protein